MYVQIPAIWFYFVLGILVGIVFIITVAKIYINNMERKAIEKQKQMYELLTKSDEKPKRKK